MKLQIVIVFFVFISGLLMAKQPLNCQVGQLKLALAGGQWQVSSCDDGRSLVFVTMKDNPALPFVFFVLRDGATSKIRGEGNGAKEHTSVAFTALKAMTEKEFDQLVQATLEQQKNRQSKLPKSA